MANAKTRTFRMRPLDEWALVQAREALGGDADNTSALQLLVDLGIEVGVQRGYWKAYQPPTIEDRLGPERVAAARAALQGASPQGGVGTDPQPGTEISNEKRNNRSPVDVTPGDGKPLTPDADVGLEEPLREVEDEPAGPLLFDDGPDLPAGWEPLEPGEYDATCDGCGVSDLRWVGPRQPRGLRRFQDRAGTIHNPGACRRRQKGARSG